MSREEPLKIFGFVCFALFVAVLIIFHTESVNTSDLAKQALVDRVSESLSVGTVLLGEDQNTSQQDYIITHSHSENNTKVWVWDYAAEDGDYVQALADGATLGDAFMIRHKPVELTVPAVGDVQIKGVRDGGGGITYAIHYALNNSTYFNSAPEGEFNTYTLNRE